VSEKRKVIGQTTFTSEHDDYFLVMEYMQKTLPTFTPSREDIPFCMMYPDSDGYYLEGTGNIEIRSGGGSYEVELWKLDQHMVCTYR
jgi:hypothetical protein